MYRNTTTPGILELDRGADLGPPPPDEGAEPLSPPRVRIRWERTPPPKGRTTDICPER